MKEKVNSPSHYHKESGIEVIDAIENWLADGGVGFMIGNIIKYVSRSQHKEDALTDLKKAQWYLNRLVQKLEERQNDDRP